MGSISHSVVSNSQQPHGWQHTRLPCSLLAPGACSNSCPLSGCCQPITSSSITPFSCPQSFPASGSFPKSWLFSSGGHSIGASALICLQIPTKFPANTTGYIRLCCTRFIILCTQIIHRKQTQ